MGAFGCRTDRTETSSVPSILTNNWRQHWDSLVLTFDPKSNNLIWGIDSSRTFVSLQPKAQSLLQAGFTSKIKDGLLVSTFAMLFKGEEATTFFFLQCHLNCGLLIYVSLMSPNKTAKVLGLIPCPAAIIPLPGWAIQLCIHLCHLPHV